MKMLYQLLALSLFLAACGRIESSKSSNDISLEFNATCTAQVCGGRKGHIRNFGNSVGVVGGRKGHGRN